MKRLHLCVLWAMLMGSTAWAAEPNDYHFAPGDVIEVSVTPQRNFDRTVTVQPDGKISYPLVGQIPVAGLTIAQLTAKLTAGLNRDLVNPSVTVTLKELNKQAVSRVSLLGAVRNPNVYDIKTGTTVAEVLASGGGPNPLADLRRVTVTHPDRTYMTLDLSETGKTGRLDRNMVLQAGDIVVVPEGSPPTVLVLGEVTKPGSIEIQGESRLLDVISTAGGPTPKADLSRVTFGRAGKAGTRTLDLMPLLSHGDTANRDLNLIVAPGDTIIVPETDQRMYVVGRVVKPDIYPIKPNDRILDALVKAGGAAGDGNLSKAVLVRRGPNGQPVAKPVDLKKVMSKGLMAENELVRPGDVLFVPDKKTRQSGAGLLNLIWPLTSVLGALR